VIAGCGAGESSDQSARAAAEARGAYAEAVKRGEDLAAGPCIAERLPGLDDWVADVAHDPRRPVDDDPANQCHRFRSGEAHHFVELTPGGRLIRAQ
jgi:hypothetical protein